MPADVDVNHIRPLQPLWPVRKVDKLPGDRREHEGGQQKHDDGDDKPKDADDSALIDTYA